MAWYYGTYACGCEGRTDICGPTKKREWISEQRFSTICPECAGKRRALDREVEHKKLAEYSKEVGLMTLSGSENQVNWANKLRVGMLEEIKKVKVMISENSEELLYGYQEILEILGEYAGVGVDSPDEVYFSKMDELLVLVIEYVSQIEMASWFIDIRYNNFETFLTNIKEGLFEYKRISLDVEYKKILDDSTVYPKRRRKDGSVAIRIFENQIVAEYTSDLTFRDIVKRLQYRWDGHWVRKINSMTGNAIDRAAELGNKLLNEGFAIQIANEEARQKAVSGDFMPECDRWILFESGRTLKIWWRGKNDQIYKAARQIKGSRYRGGVQIDVEYYAEVLEFAELFGFEIEDKAKTLIKHFIEDEALVSRVDPGNPAVFSHVNGLEQILESSRLVIEDLKDDL